MAEQGVINRPKTLSRLQKDRMIPASKTCIDPDRTAENVLAVLKDDAETNTENEANDNKPIIKTKVASKTAGRVCTTAKVAMSLGFLRQTQSQLLKMKSLPTSKVAVGDSEASHRKQQHGDGKVMHPTNVSEKSRRRAQPAQEHGLSPDTSLSATEKAVENIPVMSPLLRKASRKENICSDSSASVKSPRNRKKLHNVGIMSSAEVLSPLTSPTQSESDTPSPTHSVKYLDFPSIELAFDSCSKISVSSNSSEEICGVSQSKLGQSKSPSPLAAISTSTINTCGRDTSKSVSPHPKETSLNSSERIKTPEEPETTILLGTKIASLKSPSSDQMKPSSVIPTAVSSKHPSPTSHYTSPSSFPNQATKPTTDISIQLHRATQNKSPSLLPVVKRQNAKQNNSQSGRFQMTKASSTDLHTTSTSVKDHRQQSSTPTPEQNNRVENSKSGKSSNNTASNKEISEVGGCSANEHTYDNVLPVEQNKSTLRKAVIDKTGHVTSGEGSVQTIAWQGQDKLMAKSTISCLQKENTLLEEESWSSCRQGIDFSKTVSEINNDVLDEDPTVSDEHLAVTPCDVHYKKVIIEGDTTGSARLKSSLTEVLDSQDGSVSKDIDHNNILKSQKNIKEDENIRVKEKSLHLPRKQMEKALVAGCRKGDIKIELTTVPKSKCQGEAQTQQIKSTLVTSRLAGETKVTGVKHSTLDTSKHQFQEKSVPKKVADSKLQRRVEIKTTKGQMSVSSTRQIDGQTAKREAGTRNTMTKNLQSSREISHRKLLGGSLDARSISSTRESSVDSRFDDDTASVTSELSVTSSVSSRGHSRLSQTGKPLLTKRGGTSNSGAALKLTPVYKTNQKTSKPTVAVPMVKKTISKPSPCANDNTGKEKSRLSNATHVSTRGGKSVLSAKGHAQLKGSIGVRETTQTEARKPGKETVAGKEKDVTIQSLKEEVLQQGAIGDGWLISAADSRIPCLENSLIENVERKINQTGGMSDLTIIGDEPRDLIGSIDVEITDRADPDWTRRQDTSSISENDESVKLGLEPANIHDSTNYCDSKPEDGRIKTPDANNSLGKKDGVGVALTPVSGSDTAYIESPQPVQFDARAVLGTGEPEVSRVDSLALVRVQITTSSQPVSRQTGGRHRGRWGFGASKLAGSCRVTAGVSESALPSNASDTREKVKHNSGTQRKGAGEDNDDEQLESGATDSRSTSLAQFIACSSSYCADLETSCGRYHISGSRGGEPNDSCSRESILNPVLSPDRCDMNTEHDVISSDGDVKTQDVFSLEGRDGGISLDSRNVTSQNVISSNSCNVTNQNVISSDGRNVAHQNVISSDSRNVTTQNVISSDSRNVTPQNVISSDSRNVTPQNVISSDSRNVTTQNVISSDSRNTRTHKYGIPSDKHGIEAQNVISLDTICTNTNNSVISPQDREVKTTSVGRLTSSANSNSTSSEATKRELYNQRTDACPVTAWPQESDSVQLPNLISSTQHDMNLSTGTETLQTRISQTQDPAPPADSQTQDPAPPADGISVSNLLPDCDSQINLSSRCLSTGVDEKINPRLSGDESGEHAADESCQAGMVVSDGHNDICMPAGDTCVQDMMPVSDKGIVKIMPVSHETIAESWLVHDDNVHNIVGVNVDCSTESVYLGDNGVYNVLTNDENTKDIMPHSGEDITDIMPHSGEYIDDIMPVTDQDINGVMPLSDDDINDTIPVSGENIDAVMPSSVEYMNDILPVSDDSIRDMPVNANNIHGFMSGSDETSAGNSDSIQGRCRRGKIIGDTSEAVENVTANIITSHLTDSDTRFTDVSQVGNKSFSHTYHLEDGQSGVGNSRERGLHFGPDDTVGRNGVALDIGNSLATLFQDDEEEGSLHEDADVSQNDNEETDSDNTDVCFVKEDITFYPGTRGCCYETSHMSKSLSDSSDGRHGDLVSYGTPPSSNSDVREGGKEETAEDLEDEMRRGCGLQRFRHKTLAEVSMNESLYTSALDNVKHRHSGYEDSSMCDEDIVEDYVENMESVLGMEDVTADDVEDVSSDNDAESMASSESSFQSATSDIIMATVSSSSRELALFEGFGTSKAGEGMAKLIASDSMHLDVAGWEDTNQSSGSQDVLHEAHCNNDNIMRDTISTRALLFTSTPRINKHERRSSPTTFNNNTSAFVTPKCSVSQTLPDCAYQTTNDILSKSTRAAARLNVDSDQMCHEGHSTLGTTRMTTISSRDVDGHSVIKRDHSLHKARIPRALSCPNVQPRTLCPQASGLGPVTYSKRHSSYLPTTRVTHLNIDGEEAPANAAEFHAASAVHLKSLSMLFSSSEAAERKFRQRRVNENKALSHLPVRSQPIDPTVLVQSFKPVAQRSRSPTSVHTSMNVGVCSSLQPQPSLDQTQKQQLKPHPPKPGKHPLQIPLPLRNSDTACPHANSETKPGWAKADISSKQTRENLVKTDVSVKYSGENLVKTNVFPKGSDVNCPLHEDEDLLENSFGDNLSEFLSQGREFSKDWHDGHTSIAINKSTNFPEKKQQTDHKTKITKESGATIMRPQGKRLGDVKRFESSESLKLGDFIETVNNDGDGYTVEAEIVKKQESAEPGTKYDNKNMKTDLRPKSKLAETVTGRDKETHLTFEDSKTITECSNLTSSNEMRAAKTCADLLNSASELVSYHWSDTGHPSTQDSLKISDSDILEVELFAGSTNIFGCRSEAFSLHQEKTREARDTRSSLFESGYSSDIKSPDVRSPVQEIENAHRHCDQIISQDVDFNKGNKTEAYAALSVFTSLPDVRMSAQNTTARRIPVLNKKENRGDNLKPGLSVMSSAGGGKVEGLNAINVSCGTQKHVQAEQEIMVGQEEEELGHDEHPAIKGAEYSGNMWRQLPSYVWGHIETAEKPWADVNKPDTTRDQVSDSLTCLYVDTEGSGMQRVCHSATSEDKTAHHEPTGKTGSCIEDTGCVREIGKELETHREQFDIFPENIRTQEGSVNTTSAVKPCDYTCDVSQFNDVKTSLETAETVSHVRNQTSGNDQVIIPVEISDIRDIPAPLGDSPRAGERECCLTHSSEKHTCTCPQDLSRRQFTSIQMDLGQNTDPLEFRSSRPCCLPAEEYQTTGSQLSTGSLDGCNTLASGSSSGNATPMTAEADAVYLPKTYQDMEVIANSFYNNEYSNCGVEGAHAHVQSASRYSCSTCQDGVVSQVEDVVINSDGMLTHGAGVLAQNSTSSTLRGLKDVKTAAGEVSGLGSSFREKIGAVEENQCVICSEVDNVGRSLGTDTVISSKDWDLLDKLDPEVRLDAASLCQPSSSPLPSTASALPLSIASDAVRQSDCSAGATVESPDDPHTCERDVTYAYSSQQRRLSHTRSSDCGWACLQSQPLDEQTTADPSSSSHASTWVDDEPLGSSISPHVDISKMTASDIEKETERRISLTCDPGIHIRPDTADISTDVNSSEESWVGLAGVNVRTMETTSSHVHCSPSHIQKLSIPGDSHNVWSKGDNSGSQTPRKMSFSPQTEGPPREKSPLILEIVCELLSRVAASEHRAGPRTKPVTPQNEACRPEVPVTTNMTPQEIASGARVINKWKSMVKKSRVGAIRESLKVKLAASDNSNSHLPPAVSPTPARKYKWARGEAGIWMKIYLDDSTKDAKQDNHEVGQERSPDSSYDEFLPLVNSHYPSGSDITQDDSANNKTRSCERRVGDPDVGLHTSDRLLLFDSSNFFDNRHNVDFESSVTSSLTLSDACPEEYLDNRANNEQGIADDDNVSNKPVSKNRSSKEKEVSKSGAIYEGTRHQEALSSMLFNSNLADDRGQTKHVKLGKDEANSSISISHTQAAEVATCFPKSGHVMESRHIDPGSRRINGIEDSDKGNVTDNETVNRVSGAVEPSAWDNVVTGSLESLKVEKCPVVTSLNSEYKGDASTSSVTAMCRCETEADLCFCTSSTTGNNCNMSVTEVPSADHTSERSLAVETWKDQTRNGMSQEMCSLLDRPSCYGARSSSEHTGPVEVQLASPIAEIVHPGLYQDNTKTPHDVTMDISSQTSSRLGSVGDIIHTHVKGVREPGEDNDLTASPGQRTSTESKNEACDGEFSKPNMLHSFDGVIESTAERKTTFIERNRNEQCKTRAYKYNAISGGINTPSKVNTVKPICEQIIVSGKSMSLNDVSLAEGFSVNKEPACEAKSLTMLDQNKYDDSYNSDTQSGISPNEEVIRQGEHLSLKPEPSFVRKPGLATGQAECTLDANSGDDDITDQICLGNDMEKRKPVSKQRANLAPVELHQMEPGNSGPKEADSGIKKPKKHTWPTVAESLKRFQKSIAENSHRSQLQRGREQQFLKSSTKAYLAAQNVKKTNYGLSTKQEIGGSVGTAIKNVQQTEVNGRQSGCNDTTSTNSEYSRCSNTQLNTSNAIQLLTANHPSSVPCDSTTTTSMTLTNTLVSPPLSSVKTLWGTDAAASCRLSGQRSQPETLLPSNQNESVMDAATPSADDKDQSYCKPIWSPHSAAGHILPTSSAITPSTEEAAPYKSLNFHPPDTGKRTGLTSGDISLESEIISTSDNRVLSDMTEVDSVAAVTMPTCDIPPQKLEPALALGQPQRQGHRLLLSRSNQDDEQNPYQHHGLSESARVVLDESEFYTTSSHVSSRLAPLMNAAANTTSTIDTTSTMDTTSTIDTTSTMDTTSTIDTTSAADSASIVEQADMLSPRTGARRHMSSAKLISVSVWDTHDGDKTGRHSRRLWPPEELPTLAGISEIEEAQSNHDCSTVKDTDVDLQDSTLLQTRDDCKERVRASRSPVRPQSKQRKAARRSLSLPTGGLSYGDVKILYKDGHFVMVDTSSSQGTRGTGETTGKLEGVSEENEKPDPSSSVHSVDPVSSSCKDESEDGCDIESKVRAEILSLLERGITDPQAMQTDTWDSVDARRIRTGAPVFLTLPRRTTRHGPRPVSVDEAKLWKYYSKSQQSLISHAELNRRREEDQEARRISNLKRHNTFSEARYSSLVWNDPPSSVESKDTVNTDLCDSGFSDSHHKQSTEESQNSKSRLKGPGFFQRMLLKRRGSGSEKSLSISTKVQQKNDLSSSSVSLASVSSTNQQHQGSSSKRDNRDSSIGRKMSFRGIFKRKNSTDESGRKASNSDENCSPPVGGCTGEVGPSVPSHSCSSQDTEVADEYSNGLVAAEVDDTFSHFQFRSRSPRTPLSNCSSQSSLYCSLSQDDSDCTPVAFQADGSSHHARGPSGRFRNRTTVTSGERSSGDSFSEYDLSSSDLRSSDGTLTPRSISPCAANSTLDNDRTLLASPTGSNRLSPPVYQKLTTSPLGARRRRSKEEETSQKTSGSGNESTTSSRSVEMVSRNSNDSGIQNDGNVNSSAESIQTTVKLRKSKSPSPTTDRPKSDTTVRWADLLEEVMESGAVRYRQDAAKLRKQLRPRSDIDETTNDEESDVEDTDCNDESDGHMEGGFRTDSRHAILINANSLSNINTGTSAPTAGPMMSNATHITTCSATDMRVLMQSRESLLSLVELRRPRRGARDPLSTRLSKNRRLSTPQPITLRMEKPQTRPARAARTSGVLTHSHSMPDSLDKLTRKNYFSLIGSDVQSITSQQSADDSSDESEYSMGYHTEASHSTRSSRVMLGALDQIIGNENLTYAEALWDHVTMDPEELGFRAGDLIRVTDSTDKHWWFGSIDDHEGWFPATFVRLRVNQDVMEEELAYILAEEEEAPRAAAHHGALAKSSNYMGKTQARANVVNEIIGAEREYVKHLRDVVEGYVKQARKRPEMFPKDKVNTIFSNIEDIFKFATELLDQLEQSVNHNQPHLSELGRCFLDKVEGFELYSDYCNNHTAACEELRELYRNKRYRHFFEACRLLQEMIEIPLEGFLLTPVQKICKYHLQLAELLKFTPSDHPDFGQVQSALEAMKKMAMLVNERKRKMESVEKLAAWQLLVDDWEGPDILEGSSELIYSGELNKVNHAGWSQERYFFLFDHQLVYCKKDLLKKSSFCFKGRINMDSCQVINVADGRDSQYNVSVRNGWKLHDTSSDKWYLLVAKTAVIKQRWLKAFQDERRRVKDDIENNFNIPNHIKQAVITNFKQKANLSKPKGILLWLTRKSDR